MGYFEESLVQSLFPDWTKEVKTLKTSAMKYCKLTKLMNGLDVNERQT